MADLAVTNTLTALSEIKAAPLNTNFSDVVSYINARNGGSTAWDALSVTGASTLTGAVTMGSTLGVTGAITATGGIASLFGYRRPNLTFIGVTSVDVENNTGTANQTTIVFPDGTIRSVTEDTSSTHKYRRFIITATAEFTTGTEDSGLYSGLSETNNTWYAIYAVKSAIDTTKFVLVGTTTLPLRANFATLNTNLGTNGWVYLGLIRNGDGVSAAGDILNFSQSGGITTFRNSYTGPSTSVTSTGLLLAAAAVPNTWAYSAGTGTTSVPNHISTAVVSHSISTAGSFALDSAAGIRYTTVGSVGGAGVSRVVVPIVDGLSATGTGAAEIGITTFFDPLLDGTHQVL